MNPSRAVLITGVSSSSGLSSGTGRALALRLHRAGWPVYASGRSLTGLKDLAQEGITTLRVDVTDEESMTAAVDRITAEHGAVGVLINNAGYSQSGAIETVPLEAVRRQFETNVFGLARLTQLVLPRMREQRWGKVVNLGSMGGRLVFPGGGWYHATKYALEAVSDALRFEVRGFGIDVILLEPGLITTEFAQAASASMERVGADGADGADPYAQFNATVESATKDAYTGPLRLFGAGPEHVAKVIERSIRKRRAPTRVTITPSAKLTIPTRRLLPDRAWDALMRAQFPRPE